VINSGKNGFLCQNLNDWRMNLELLINNPDLRKKIGENAYDDILQKYIPQVMTKKCIEIFNHLANSN
jgi:spore maturation protein CgeB